jgi:hypothetical protein
MWIRDPIGVPRCSPQSWTPSRYTECDQWYNKLDKTFSLNVTPSSWRVDWSLFSIICQRGSDFLLAIFCIFGSLCNCVKNHCMTLSPDSLEQFSVSGEELNKLLNPDNVPTDKFSIGRMQDAYAWVCFHWRIVWFAQERPEWTNWCTCSHGFLKKRRVGVRASSEISDWRR